MVDVGVPRGAGQMGCGLPPLGWPAALGRRTRAAPLLPLDLLGGGRKAEEPPLSAGTGAEGVAEGRRAPRVLLGEPGGCPEVGGGTLPGGGGLGLYV